MYLILDAIVKLLAPVLAFTAEEIWQFMPHRAGENKDSIMFSEMPSVCPEYENAALEEKWDKLIAVRNDVNKALELARNEKLIGKSLDAEVTVSGGRAYVKTAVPVRAATPGQSAVFYDGLQDMRARQLLAERIGTSVVVNLLENEFGGITFTEYPRGAEKILKMRKIINNHLDSLYKL